MKPGKTKLSQTKVFHVLFWFCIVGAIVCIALFAAGKWSRWSDAKALSQQTKKLKELTTEKTSEVPELALLPTAGITQAMDDANNQIKVKMDSMKAPEILPEYKELYQQNQDMIGWLKIKDTVIDYPVMQTPGQEDYYLTYDFNKNKNRNGSLILDTDSTAGTGTSLNSYLDGIAPSTNLIIHGHTMKSGEMFGNLKLYQKQDYGQQHSVIEFDSLYEKREYELISVFFSQVFNKDQKVFKYYNFFHADNQEQFDDWYQNIKKMSLYDTGVTAEYGDEFITLSCCSYQTKDGRFVVVGKRVR